jgi:S-(hydroxymethyl)glutathione dehydrogenase / alcohol dehydrogenase
MKTIAAILVENKKDLVIDEIEIPQLNFGQVLVKVNTTRICGSQIGEIDGVKGPDRWLPHLLGHEAGADVMEVGAGVSTVQPGDRVVLHWRKGSGLNGEGPRYNWNGKVVNAGNITTFSQYSIISENRMTKVADDIDYEICALLADTLTTGFGVINNDAKVKIGESVVVIGCGGIGLGAILGASLAGANPIIGLDIFDHKLEKAKQYGATHGIKSRDIDIKKAVEEIVGATGCDVVVDNTGIPEMIETAYSMTSSKGRCVGVGVMPSEKSIKINTLPLHFGKTLTGSEGGSSLPDIDIPRYTRMIRDGLFDPSGFISHRGELSEINGLIGQMRRGEVIHAVVKF